jgi:Kef-type K+ transport system membrane component KefB
VHTEQLILSAGAILLAARALGRIFQRIGQPRVLGEMTAGILLGPSLFGRLSPSAFAYVFPSSSLPALTTLSQLGLLLFMFLVGLEVDLKRILKQRAAVVLISNVSIVLPLVLGIGLASVLYPKFAGESVSFSSFALFMGTAMSITAFPVLARILKERNLLGTDLGTTAISCAAIDDISAWLLLALLTATVHSAQSWRRLAVTLLLLIAFVAIMLVPVRYAASSLAAIYRKHGAGVELISTLILVMLAASWATESLGVHACSAHSWLVWSCRNPNQ